MFTSALAHTPKFWQYLRSAIHSRYMLRLGNSFFIVMLLVSNITGSVQARPAHPDERSASPAKSQTSSLESSVAELFANAGKTAHSGIIQQDATPTPTDCVQAPDDLIAYWPADEDAKDIIGGHNGSLINGTAYETGKFGQAFSFDGSNDYVDLGNWFTFQDFSVSMWVKAGDAQQTYADIIDNNHRTGVNWVVQQSVDQVNQYSWSGVVEFGLTEGQWQHLVVSHDSQGIYTTYLDGVLVNSVQAGLINYNGTQFLRLGTWGGGGRNWKGLLDEVKVYNRALTSTEVSALFADTGTKLCSKQIDVTGSDVEITSPSFLQADGVQSAMITVTVKNTDGNPVSNAKVILDIVGDETQLQYASETTDANGVISAHLTSTVPGVKSVKAGIVTPGGTLSLLKVPTVVFKGAEISGKVYQDKNGNGEFDPGEEGIVGVPVNLLAHWESPWLTIFWTRI